jgi:tetraacyldisaccharide 4'-kinase
MWVSRDRVLGARKAAANGAEVVVMDDGHQNPDLRKTLSLVVVDGETREDEWPFGDGKVFPAGPMREPLAVSLARTDAVIVLLPDDLPQADPALLALFGDTPVLIARLEPAVPPPKGRRSASPASASRGRSSGPSRPPAATWSTSRPIPTTANTTRRR